MTTVWRRKGLLVGPPSGHSWWRSRAGVPTCLPIDDRLWRIWFGGLDDRDHARPLCIDVDPGEDMRILALRDVPGLALGGDGAFDSAGLWPSAAIETDGWVMLWYTGMRLDHPFPYTLAIGLAVSRDGGLSFEKIGEDPVLAPVGSGSFVSTPCVRRHAGGFEMWYSHGIGWQSSDHGWEPYYDIRRTFSSDGVTWPRAESPALTIEGTDWAGLARPWLDLSGAEPTLWFGARGARHFRRPSASTYRVFSAPLRGTVIDPTSIRPTILTPSPTPDDWDSWMQTCPCVVPSGDNRVMLYHGNEFGSTGFGYAISEKA